MNATELPAPAPVHRAPPPVARFIARAEAQIVAQQQAETERAIAERRRVETELRRFAAVQLGLADHEYATFGRDIVIPGTPSVRIRWTECHEDGRRWDEYHLVNPCAVCGQGVVLDRLDTWSIQVSLGRHLNRPATETRACDECLERARGEALKRAARRTLWQRVRARLKPRPRARGDHADERIADALREFIRDNQ